jgi:hypothetical protein
MNSIEAIQLFNIQLSKLLQTINKIDNISEFDIASKYLLANKLSKVALNIFDKHINSFRIKITNRDDTFFNSQEFYDFLQECNGNNKNFYKLFSKLQNTIDNIDEQGKSLIWKTLNILLQLHEIAI